MSHQEGIVQILSFRYFWNPMTICNEKTTHRILKQIILFSCPTLTAFGLLHVDGGMEAGACLFSMLIVSTNNCVTVFVTQWLSRFRKSVSSAGCKKSTKGNVSSDPTGESYKFSASVEIYILILFLKLQAVLFI